MKKTFTTLCLSMLVAASAYAQYGNGMNYRWVRSAKSNGVDRYNRICMSATQDIYAAGCFSGMADISNGSDAGQSVSSAGQMDGLLVSYDRFGNLQWSVTVGGSQNDEALALTSDRFGYAYVGGYFRGTISIRSSVGGDAIELTSAGGKDGFVARVHPNGNLMWAYRFGGAGDDEANALDVTYNLRHWVGGTYSGNVNLQGVVGEAWPLHGHGGTDAFLARANDWGGITWAVEAGGAGNDRACGVTANLNGGTLLGAYERTATFYNADYEARFSKTALGGQDGFLFQVGETNGQYGFVSSFGGRGNDDPADLAADPRGTGVVAVGSFTGTAGFGGTNLSSAGSTDAFFARFGNSGSVEWAKRMGSFGEDNGQSVKLDRNGNVLIGANYTLLSQMPNGQWLLSLGWLDGLVMKLSANGSQVQYYTQVVGLRGDDQILGVDTSENGGVHMAGVYNGGTRFGYSSTYNCSGNASDAYMACYMNTSNLREGVDEEFATDVRNAVLRLAPNPATAGSTIAVFTEGLQGSCTLRAFDMTGRPVMSQEVEASGLLFGQKIETGLSTGTYMIVLQDEMGRTRQSRLVVK